MLVQVQRALLREEVFDRVDQGAPAGLNDVVADTDGSPLFLTVAAEKQDASFGSCAHVAVDDADFVVLEFHFIDLRIGGAQGFAQSAIECVDRAVTFGDAVFLGAFDIQLHGS